MSKADIAMISPVLLAIELILPGLVSEKILSHPMDVYLFGQTSRIIASILLYGVLQYVYYLYHHHNGTMNGYELTYFDFYFILFIMMFHKASSNLSFISAISFYSRISDPSIGGTYMTFLNAMSNLSAKWTGVLSLWLLPKLTYQSCIHSRNGNELIGHCDIHHGKICHDQGGICITNIDGYTIITGIGLVYGIYWIITTAPKVKYLQSLPHQDWLLTAIPTTTTTTTSTNNKK